MRLRITAAAAVFTLTATAGIALADVTVYTNTFSSKSAIGDLQKLDGGDACKRGWIKDDKELSLEIKKGTTSCVFATPVRGDAPQPDHLLEVEATISKDVPKSLRDELFVAVSVRNDDSTEYELRVFPDTRTWELRRDPEIEGLPMQGTDTAIAGLGKANKLSLQAFGDVITAAVNGKKLVDGFVDPNPTEVEGRRTAITFGSEAEVKGGATAALDDLAVAIPDPS